LTIDHSEPYKEVMRVKKTELIKRLRVIGEALHVAHEQLQMIEETYNDLEELRDEVSETRDGIPESFADRQAVWEEYCDEVDGITSDMETIKDAFSELEEVIERVENFVESLK